jgi:hypothetical protein
MAAVLIGPTTKNNNEQHETLITSQNYERKEKIKGGGG